MMLAFRAGIKFQFVENNQDLFYVMIGRYIVSANVERSGYLVAGLLAPWLGGSTAIPY